MLKKILAVLQIAAIPLSAFAAITLICQMLKGPQIDMNVPVNSFITMFTDNCQDGESIVEFVVPVLMANNGARDQSDYYNAEWVRITLTPSNEGEPQKIAQYTAFQYVQTIETNVKSQEYKCDARQGTEFLGATEYPGFIIKPLRRAGVGYIDGKSAIVNEIHYVSDIKLCDQNGANCNDEMSFLTMQNITSNEDKDRQLRFEFFVNFHHSQIIKRSCTIDLTPSRIKLFKSRYLMTLDCNPEDSS